MANQKAFEPTNQRFFSTNFYDAVEPLVPQFYITEDYNLSGVAVDPIDYLLSSHLELASNFTSVIPVSVASLTGTIYSSINTLSGISNYFVIQNNLTNISSERFEKRVLSKLNKAYEDFSSSSSFHGYVTSIFIPGTRLNTPTLSFTDESNPHRFLVQELSWLYLLNTSGRGNLVYEPSTGVASLISDFYNGKSVDLPTCLEVLEEFLWKNTSVSSSFRSYIPPAYLSGTDNLDALKTLITILYSPLYFNSRNFKVRDAFEDKINRQYSTESVVNGPFTRLLKAFSYKFADISNDIDKLDVLYDIQECPDDLLPELANLIGWRLFGFDADKWRLQLANAVDIYKRAGTKQSLQVAVNSIFSQDVFNISSNIYELWESYIPNLAYYALGTDSSAFDSFKIWTPTLASKLGVSGYSTSSMDENIRLAIDTILYTLVTEYPQMFKLGNSQFPIGDSNFKFYYRNRIFPIPPWEEYPYYANANLTEDVVDRFADLLACFGVRQEFALQVRDYILDNAIRASDDIRSGNGWLIFTSGSQTPPNFDYVVSRIGEKNVNAINAWSNKSSHFKLILDSSSFDFTKGSFDSDSFHALREVSRVVTEFSPAHSIPDIRVNANASDEYDPVDYSGIVAINNTIDGYLGNDLSSINTKSFATYESKGANTRGIFASATFGREYFDSITDSSFSTTALVSSDRSAFRRRSLMSGYTNASFYSRTGFNMPIAWTASTLEHSMPSSLGFLPLGYIPSAGKYMDITDVHNLPTVYRICHLNGSSVFSGVPVSSTFPCRGNTLISSTLYVDRSNIPELIGVAHTLREKEKLILAEKAINPNLSAYQKDFYWKHVYQSYANANLSAFPNSYTDYMYTPFGREINKLYRIWVKDFALHSLNQRFFDIYGPTIFAHAYGSIFENSEFDYPGSLLVNYPELQASSPREIIRLNRSTLFNSASSLQISAASSQVVSSYNLSSNPYKEFRNLNLFSGIEFVYPHNISNDNYYAVLNLSPTLGTEQNEFFVQNPTLIIKTVNGLPRLRFNLKSPIYGSSMGYGVSSNFLLPEHRFNFRVKGIPLSEDGRYLGGLTVGVWIHTAPEGNTFYTYTGSEEWERCDIQNITNDNVNSWAFKYTYETIDKDQLTTTGIKKFKCIDLILNPGATTPLLTLDEENFRSVDFEFHTKNLYQSLTPDYVRSYGSLHKKTQNYIIEFFIVANQNSQDKVFILDSVELKDLTLESYTKYKTQWGTYVGRPFNPYCPVSSIQLSELELLCLFQDYYSYQETYGSRSYDRLPPENVILGPVPGVRIGTQIQTLHGVSGGGKLTYRLHPDWVATTGAGNYYSSIVINN